MSISREQVADLQPGDVVRITSSEWPDGAAVEGPLTVGQHEAVGLVLDHPHIPGAYWVRTESGEPYDREARTLTVVSRAPRPLYVNSDRTEPVPGDVVRDDQDPPSADTWAWVQPTASDGHWRHIGGGLRYTASEMPARLRLLVDGTTGMAVTA